MTLPTLAALAFLLVPVPSQADAQPSTRQSPQSMAVRTALSDLASVRRILARIRQTPHPRRVDLAADWGEFAWLVEALVGSAQFDPRWVDALRGNEPGPAATVPVTLDVGTRDAAADRLLAVGYSVRETADVISGRITRAALDTARRMLMRGAGRNQAEQYLAVHYRPGVAEGPSPAGADRTAPETTTGALDTLIERHARAHRIDQALVRAVIAVESGFDQAARSRAGAVGLMQLMPATARALGVNPLVAEENVAGGVRYLADLLESFGTVELALVAYNGGPGLARRYARGEAVLYGETRDYVRLVMDRLRHSRP